MEVCGRYREGFSEEQILGPSVDELFSSSGIKKGHFKYRRLCELGGGSVE